MRPWKILTALALVCAGLAPPTTSVAATAVQLTATYGTNVGVLDKDRVLNVSQGGYLTLQNLHVLPDHVDELAALGIRELRIDHVFDDEFYDVVKGVDRFDFSKLDRIIVPLVQKGIRPWISLSYMPKELGPAWNGPPNDNAAWGRAVQAMVSHYAAKGPEYRGWNWEVWNEPENFFGDVLRTDAFNAMYAASAHAVRRADPTASVGGIGAVDTGGPYMDAWLAYLGRNPNVPVDFVSWHHYGGNDFASTATMRTKLAGRGIPPKKLYINEWNANANMGNGPGSWADTHQAASYALQRMYEAQGESGLTGTHFFSGLEGWTPHLDFNGDLGMLTVEGRRKAVGNAFAAFAGLPDTRLKTVINGGEGTSTHGLVTADPDTRKVSLLLWNNEETATTFTAAVNELPYDSTNFAVTRSDIDAVNGNSWHDRATGFTAQRPSRHERLAPTNRTVAGPAQSWSTTLTLPPNGSTLIELTPTSEPVGAKSLPPVPTTVNLARDGAVSSSSAETVTGKGWFAEALTDGRRYSYPAVNADRGAGPKTSGWTSIGYPSAAATSHVQVDLGSRRDFDEITLWPRSDQAGDGLGFPADFVIAGSADGTNWTPLVTKTGYGNGSAVHGPQKFEVAGSALRYVRVTATKLGLPIPEGSPVYRFQLAELEVTKRAVNAAIANPGFETGNLGGWTATGNGRIVADAGRSGKHAATFTGAGHGVILRVSGLRPNTRYTFSGYLKSGDAVHLGVKDYGGTELSLPVTGTARWNPASVTFTTGATDTAASVYAYKNSGTAQAWFDDFALTADP